VLAQLLKRSASLKEICESGGYKPLLFHAWAENLSLFLTAVNLPMVNVSVYAGEDCVATCVLTVSTFWVVSADEMRVSDFGSCFWSFIAQEKAVKVKSSKSLNDGRIKNDSKHINIRTKLRSFKMRKLDFQYQSCRLFGLRCHVLYLPQPSISTPKHRCLSMKISNISFPV
jgi:hypothetical protein